MAELKGKTTLPTHIDMKINTFSQTTAWTKKNQKLEFLEFLTGELNGICQLTQPNLPCLSLFSIVVEKCLDKKQLGEGLSGWLVPIIVHHEENLGKVFKGDFGSNNWGRNHGGLMLTGFLFTACFACFLDYPLLPAHEWHQLMWTGSFFINH